MEDKTFLDHLEDLRWVILKSCVVLAVAMMLACLKAREIIVFLRAPLDRILIEKHIAPDSFLLILGVVDPFTLMLQIGLFVGVIVSLPFIFYFLAQFFAPALREKERKIVYPVFLFGGALFLLGVVFCYYLVLPQAIQFFLGLNDWFGWKPAWTIQNYLNFTLQMLIAFGVSFELPLVLLVLMRFGILSSQKLAHYRKHTIVILLIFAACVTPTSDPYNLALLFFPMYILFEASILIGRLGALPPYPR
ncbi:MAG: twin-arginine translocase subunit TatC [Verrucomicrobiota bacterium]